MTVLHVIISILEYPACTAVLALLGGGMRDLQYLCQYCKSPCTVPKELFAVKPLSGNLQEPHVNLVRDKYVMYNSNHFHHHCIKGCCPTT